MTEPRRHHCFILCAVLTFAVLGPAISCAGPGTELEIRVVNQSEVLMREVVVRFPEQAETYGDIAPGGATPYRSISKAYRYAYVAAMINGRKGVLQPIDFVGERLLAGGRYSYVLTYNPAAKEQFDLIGLEFRKD